MSDIVKDLAAIQSKLNAPKNQFNSFGKYHYRNCEDILQAVKPLLGDYSLIVSDEVVDIGGRIYVKATAKICDGSQVIEATGFAREAQAKKGMDEAQITGAASSYARKYALNGLLLIDDNKDADSQDNSKHGQPETIESYGAKIKAAKSMDALASVWKAVPKQFQQDLTSTKDKKKEELLK